MPVIRLALPLPLPQCFDYWAEWADFRDLGRLARVPFGQGEKQGVIVAIDPIDALATDKLKPAIEIQREVDALPADWLALVDFVSRYYHAPLGEVIALALPPDLRKAKPVLGTDRDALLAVTTVGHEALANPSVRESRVRQLTQMLAEQGSMRRRALRAMPGGSALSEALRRGWVGPLQDVDAAQTTGVLPELTGEQAQAVARILSVPTAFQPWVLHGVTASGKTEVYLRAVQAMLMRNRQVLMLVPEIALTPQLEARVAARFPAATVVSLHSSQAAGVRSNGYVQALTGQAHIVLGTRLAVFAPMPRLGLIILDEEHDASFKQQEGIRYNARDVAVWRAKNRDIPIILGSATPSLETWHHAQQGRYALISMTQRAVALHLPKVQLVDTRHVRTVEGFSAPLHEAISTRLARGEQSLIFLNRRGFAPILACTACMWVSACPHCSAHLVYHLKDQRQRCHHCGWDAAVPAACPSCGNQDLKPLGRGTQRIESHLSELFPQARVLRLDRDAARSRKQWEALLAQIAGGEVDILVGTQMMAKGHDFPRLTLVGVLGADAALHAADFRAPERLFQQLMQVGGRAGRAVLPGEVLIQTDYPNHPLFQDLVQQDYPSFAHRALQERAQTGFPPITFQAILRADAPEMEVALAFLQHAARIGQGWSQGKPDNQKVSLYDPVPMRLARLAQRERAQLLVEARHRPTLQAFLREWVTALYACRTARTLRWHVDVDPFEV